MPLTMQTPLMSQPGRHHYRGPACVVTLPIQLPIQLPRLAPFGRASPIGPPHIEILDQVYASCSEVVLAYPHTRVIRNLDNH